MKTNLR